MCIGNYDLRRLDVAIGRTIGDAVCHYDRMTLVVVRLEMTQGFHGHGFSTCASGGTFTRRPARPMASLARMRSVFAQYWWPRLSGASIGQWVEAGATDFPYLDNAVDTALWDLLAKQADLPLYRLLGGDEARGQVLAYGSLLDFPLVEEAAVALARRFVDRGFRALKVKVGASDVKRDIERLRAIREAVGNGITLAADANENWDAPTTIARIEAYRDAGFELEYIEDPLPSDDVAGFAALAGKLPTDIAAQEYVAGARDIRPLLETGGIDRLRMNANLTQSLQFANLGLEFGLPVIYGNSPFEVNVHPACGLPGTERLEFSDLGWNDLVKQPVRFANGMAYPPDVPGHGLELREDAVIEFSRPEGPD